MKFEWTNVQEFLVEVDAIAQSRLAVVHALRHHQFADVQDQCQRGLCAHRNAHKATLVHCSKLALEKLCVYKLISKLFEPLVNS